MAKKTRKTRAEAAAPAKLAAPEQPAAPAKLAAAAKAPAPAKLAGPDQPAGPALRWFVCQDGGIHVFGPCPRCFQTSGGMLAGSALPECRGIARARCTECGETIDYYVDQQHQQVWKAEAVREPAGSARR